MSRIINEYSVLAVKDVESVLVVETGLQEGAWFHTDDTASKIALPVGFNGSRAKLTEVICTTSTPTVHLGAGGCFATGLSAIVTTF